MSIPISNDLRQRIVDRYMSHSESYDAVAEYFQVGRATVNRIINRFRRTGSVDPSPRGGGYPPWISDAELPRLRALVAELPDRTAEELTLEWRRRFGAELSRSSMVRALARAGLSFKKNPSARQSRNGPKSKRGAKPSGTERSRSRGAV